MKNYYYKASIKDFLATPEDQIAGLIGKEDRFQSRIEQKNAWAFEVTHLKRQLSSFDRADILFEYVIPRIGKRVDVLLLIEGLVFVLEYKVGASTYEAYALDQVWDYALDLKNFHEPSHQRKIVPILIATKASAIESKVCWDDDWLAEPLRSNGDNLGALIDDVLRDVSPSSRDELRSAGFSEPEQEPFEHWVEGRYKPTPTIVEAAQALYRGHNVAEIARSDAGAKNLTDTVNCISEIIDRSRRERSKSICFVTGVPGAGKTLAGLQISTQRLQDSDEHAVFLSGNGPLVAVLREALARDEVARAKADGTSMQKKKAEQKVSSFIQNIHHFRDDGLRSDDPPDEHVVVFDEAQRAWNRAHAEKFMSQKRNVADFGMSEPEFLISLMDRREDWSTIVCLIGGGQEINTGEAGLVEWFDALQNMFQHWDIYHSGQLTNKNYSWGEDLGAKLSELRAVEKPALHLAVSMRSFRAEALSAFVGAVIDGDHVAARDMLSQLDKYPLVLTRDVARARRWLRRQARGSERVGLVASSGALRLKPEGIHIKSKIDPANWFLNGKEDIRSSYYLEDVATEFDIQGLELDWTGVCWDADLRMEAGGWGFYSFKGTKWQTVHDSYRRIYLANAYRVLLTRARQGMVIFVPEGDPADHTRTPEFYDRTYEFLRKCGLEDISSI